MRKNGDVQKKEDSLPNPKDPLSFGVPGSAILLANREVQATMEKIQAETKKCSKNMHLVTYLTTMPTH